MADTVAPLPTVAMLPGPFEWKYETVVVNINYRRGGTKQVVFTRDIIGKGGFGRAKIVRIAETIDGCNYFVMKEIVVAEDGSVSIVSSTMGDTIEMIGPDDSEFNNSTVDQPAVSGAKASDPDEEKIKYSQDLLNEYKMMIRVDSEFVIKAIGWKFDEGAWFFVMEYGGHGDLWKLTQNTAHTFDVSQFFHFASDVMTGTKHLHELGIEHSDIKTENVVLCAKNGTVMAKLMDLGMATNFGDNIRGGTYTYLPSEYFTETVVTSNGQVDIYSLGCVIYELIFRRQCCKPPKNFQVLTVKINSKDCLWYQEDLVLPDPLPVALADYIRKLTRNKDVAGGRYERVADALEDLERLYEKAEVIAYLEQKYSEAPAAPDESNFSGGSGSHESMKKLQEKCDELTADDPIEYRQTCSRAKSQMDKEKFVKIAEFWKNLERNGQ